MKLRNALHAAAKVLGDVDAVRKGTIGRRVARRIKGRIAARTLSNTPVKKK